MSGEKHMVGGISRKTLERLPVYRQYLSARLTAGGDGVSAPVMAADLGLNEVQVRKDLAMVSKTAGRPRTGYQVRELLEDMEEFLGCHNENQAVLVGVGSLGRALLGYRGFEQYGVEIVTAFDREPEICREKVAGKVILPMDKLENLCRRMNIHIGIITVPAYTAQEICDRLIAGGVRAIWNFAPAPLKVPEHVLLQNENMAASLATLSKYLYELELKEGKGEEFH